MKALIIIDVQNDFMPGGALAVPGGDEIVPLINRLQENFNLVIATQDWHPKGHASFASSHDATLFSEIELNGLKQVMWPEHCLQNSKGAEFHSALNTRKFEAIFRKGTDPGIDSYSGFYDNAHLKSTGLAGYLKEKGVTELYFVGLAGDYCVYFSVKDGIKEGFDCTLIEDATRSIDSEKFQTAKADLLHRGAKVIQSSTLKF